MQRGFAAAAVIVVAALLGAGLTGCKGKGKAESAAAAGKERGPCYGNGTCDQGLTCLSQLCVVPPGADCAAIADHLAGILLGNYAPRDERTAFAADVTADCTTRKLSKDDGECLMRASGRQAIGGCPVALGVGDCAKITQHLQTLPRTDQFLVTEADRLISRCKNEVPSRALETCVMAATKVEQLGRCQW